LIYVEVCINSGDISRNLHPLVRCGEPFGDDGDAQRLIYQIGGSGKLVEPEEHKLVFIDDFVGTGR
jgi:hypothetical protein